VSIDQPSGNPAPWQWPGLWSLNLPVLIVLWQLFFAQTFHVWLGGYHFAAAAGLVWLFVGAERWTFFFRLRQPARPPASCDLEEQRLAMIRIGLLVVVGLVLMAIFRAHTREVAGMLIWSSLGGLYLLGLRLKPSLTNETLPREMAYAIYLSGTGFLMVWANAAFRPLELILPSLLFLLLLFYYFALVATWAQSLVPATSTGTLFESPLGLVFRVVPLGLIFGGVALALMSPAVAANQVLLTLGVSALTLLMVDMWQHSLPKATLRLLADAALLAPVVPMLIALW
jgi:hypothetical protein